MKVLRNITGGPLTSSRLATSRLIQVAIRQFYPFGSIRTVHRGLLKGLRYKVAPDMGFTYAWGMIEQWDFSDLVRPGMCVYDIGANCGQSTLILAKLVGASGRVVAFEPVAKNFAILVSNICLNPSLCVTPVCAAASERNGPLDFLFDSNLPTQGRLSHVDPSKTLPKAETISVRGIRLDEYILENWPAPQFLKIDVEGGAGAVLRGARSLIAHHRPTIYLDLHGPEEQEVARELLSAFRYVAHTPSGSEVPDPTAVWFYTLICKPR
jgi:FkbM family methyltransferase